VLRIERNDSGRPTTITAPGKSVSIGVASGFAAPAGQSAN
jgi:hypothetical protein